jgi:hypothetical protein
MGPRPLEIKPKGSENDRFSSVLPFPVELDRRKSVRLDLRVTPSAHAWARRLADHCSLDLTSIIWQSLMRQAAASAFYERIPPRYARKVHPNRRDS